MPDHTAEIIQTSYISFSLPTVKTVNTQATGQKDQTRFALGNNTQPWISTGIPTNLFFTSHSSSRLPPTKATEHGMQSHCTHKSQDESQNKR